MTGHILVDLDGTLAAYDTFKGPEHVGEPIPAMMARVREWLKKGEDVRLFTARAANPENIPPVRAWLDKHGLQAVSITNQKDLETKEIWDDRAIRVIENTGWPCCNAKRPS